MSQGTAWIVAALATLGLAAWFHAGWGGSTTIRWADDLACLAASALAAATAWRASRRCPSLTRCYTLVAVGAACWAGGQLVWCAYDLGLDVVPAMPGLPDIGYLLLPVFACAALLSVWAHGGNMTRTRWALDGAIVGLSGLLLIWSPALEPITHAGHGDLIKAVGLAYPAFDIALLTIATMTLVNRGTQLAGLVFALAVLSAADAVFGYLSVTGRYQVGAVSDVSYMAAFFAIAASTTPPNRDRDRQPPSRLATNPQLALPYLPFVAALGTVIGRDLAGSPMDTADLLIATGAVICLLARQYVVLVQNRQLLEQVSTQRTRLEAFAMTDALTGLANRALFTDRVDHAVALHRRDGRQLSLCWIDLDDFKIVNDTFGHLVGDELLVKVAERLREAVRAGDTLARLGGDEFAVLIEDGGDPMALAGHLCTTLDRPLHVGARQFSVSASVGIARLDADSPAVHARQIIGRADIAMYHAKQQGKNQVVLYRPGMTVPGASDITLRDALRAAITAGDIQLHYQPVDWAADGTLRGFEALARWNYRGSPIPPQRFVAVAERFGQAAELGDYVLGRAITQAAEWTRAAGSDLAISVNLSPAQLLDPGLPDRVARMLARHGLRAPQLVPEITEAALLTDSEVALDVARRLTDLGCALSLDDFGVGYSSLAHLRGFPLASMKIDRSFVSTIDVSDEARAFMAAVIRLGRDLRLRVVVEGIETPAQLQVARELGCSLLQGYLLSPPRPAQDIDVDDERLRHRLPDLPLPALPTQRLAAATGVR